MIRAQRFSIAGLMGLVLIVALSLAALRSGSPIWAGTTFLVTNAILTLAVAGAICRKGSERAWWVGFSLFGWGDLIVSLWFPHHWMNYVTNTLIVAVRPSPRILIGQDGYYINPFSQVGHCLLALTIAVIGGLLSRWFFGTPETIVATVDPGTESAEARTWLRRPVFVGSAGLAITIVVALGGLLWAPAWWAGVVVLFTWGCLGLVAIGAICQHGKRRAACLGATLFGIGYFSLIFIKDDDRPDWPLVATEQLLNALRPSRSWLVRFRPASPPVLTANARLLKALDLPIRMPFPRDTPLKEVLAYIRAATSEPDYDGIAIYVDPVGLQEAEKTMDSPVMIDLDGVPLRTSLRLVLKQLGMHFSVVDGVLLISTWESDDKTWDEFLPFMEDPDLVVGHCLLTLFAALLGGALAPLVSD